MLLTSCELLQGPAALHFPPVEFQTGINVPLVDTLGNEYSLKFRFWANGAGKIYILEGTQLLQVVRFTPRADRSSRTALTSSMHLQSRYNTHSGDSISFAQKEDGTLVVCCSSSKPVGGSGTPKKAKAAPRVAGPKAALRDGGRCRWPAAETRACLRRLCLWQSTQAEGVSTCSTCMLQVSNARIHACMRRPFVSVCMLPLAHASARHRAAVLQQALSESSI